LYTYSKRLGQHEWGLECGSGCGVRVSADGVGVGGVGADVVRVVCARTVRTYELTRAF
jgi:hypothetical protein